MKNLIIFLFFFLLGCATQAKMQAKLNTRLGMSEVQLINILGVPKSFYELGDKRYLTYDYSKNYYVPASASTYDNFGQVTTYTNGGYGGTKVCIITYTIQQNRVIDWHYKGKCTSY